MEKVEQNCKITEGGAYHHRITVLLSDADCFGQNVFSFILKTLLIPSLNNILMALSLKL